MKREPTKQELKAIREFLRWYRGAELVKLNKTMTAVLISGKWMINEEVIVR